MSAELMKSKFVRPSVASIISEVIARIFHILVVASPGPYAQTEKKIFFDFFFKNIFRFR